MSNEHLTRQLDIIPLNALDEKITVIGAGAIGSWVVLSLAKMGFHDITVYDHDHVDTVNLNSQFYPLSSVGNPKVATLHDLVRMFTGVEITGKHEKYETGMFPGIVISAVDSMEVRKTIWQNHAKKSPFTKLVVDPRMGAEEALLYAMNPMDEHDNIAYAKALYSDADSVHERCTAKATIYTANLLAGLVVKAVKDCVTKEAEPLRTAIWNIKANQLECFNRKAKA